MKNNLSSIYNNIAIICFNTFIIFLLINFILYPIILIKRNITNDSNVVMNKYGEHTIASLYPNWKKGELNQLLKETWSRNFSFEPYTMFKETNFNGRYVNIDKNGFRLSKNQSPWPPVVDHYNIFIFGGSTTFGYGVEDHQTIASHLQSFLRAKVKNEKICIYNFGRGYYFSEQERILFELLITSGYCPSMAIFIDGLNDFYHYDGKPTFYSNLSKSFNNEFELSKCITNVLLSIPVIKFIKWILRINMKTIVKNDIPERNYNNTKIINNVIKRYLNNKTIIQAVARSNSIKTLFVWQPVPTYNYSGQKLELNFSRHTFSKYGYKEMEKYYKNNKLKNFLWCGNLHIKTDKPLYIDLVHYSGFFSKHIAHTIANYIIKKNVL